MFVLVLVLSILTVRLLHKSSSPIRFTFASISDPTSTARLLLCELAPISDSNYFFESLRWCFKRDGDDEKSESIFNNCSSMKIFNPVKLLLILRIFCEGTDRSFCEGTDQSCYDFDDE
ncbi:unnamed protein product [Vicia faba]|uniref:Secreted protein n=1 Tax=Vicia faba TaxID=3906 RepID=A0AAV1AIN8_VICFA|nr:unnamed protein product [Vicia faba]